MVITHSLSLVLLLVLLYIFFIYLLIYLSINSSLSLLILLLLLCYYRVEKRRSFFFTGPQSTNTRCPSGGDGHQGYDRTHWTQARARWRQCCSRVAGRVNVTTFREEEKEEKDGGGGGEGGSERQDNTTNIQKTKTWLYITRAPNSVSMDRRAVHNHEPCRPGSASKTLHQDVTVQRAGRQSRRGGVVAMQPA